MKILVLYQYFGTPKGSWSTRIYELTKRWSLKGNEITIITAPYSKSDIRATKLVEHQQIEGLKLIVINIKDNNSDSLFKRVYNSVAFALIASYYALKTQSDIVISSSGPITIAIPGMIKQLFSQIPFVFEIRDLWPDGIIEFGMIKNKYIIQLLKWFEMRIYKSAKLIVTASEGQSNIIRKRIKEKLPLTIPNGCDIKLFTNTNNKFKLPKHLIGKPLFLHIGSMGLIHACHEIVYAAQWLKENNHQDFLNICFIGDGNDKNNLKSFCLKHDLYFVHFIDLMPKVELVNWLNSCTATIFTTVNNNVQKTCSPNKLFDSFSAGKAVIQNSTGWIMDLIEKTQCGLNVSPNNPEQFGKALLEISSNHELRSKFEEKAVLLAKNRFSRDRLAILYLDNLRKIV